MDNYVIPATYVTTLLNYVCFKTVISFNDFNLLNMLSVILVELYVYAV